MADTWLGLIRMNEPTPDHYQVFSEPEDGTNENLVYVQTASPAGGDTECAFQMQARAILHPNMVEEADRPLYNTINEVYNAHL